jgi:anti-sigma factor RsiW
MMKCEDVRKLLVAYADRALAEAEAGRTREHLDSCASCRHELELLRADAELMRSEARPEVPAYMAAKVMARLRERSGARRARFGLNLAFARVGFVLVAAVGLWLGVALGRGLVGTWPGAVGRMARASAMQAFVDGQTEGL